MRVSADSSAGPPDGRAEPSDGRVGLPDECAEQSESETASEMEARNRGDHV